MYHVIKDTPFPNLWPFNSSSAFRYQFNPIYFRNIELWLTLFHRYGTHLSCISICWSMSIMFGVWKVMICIWYVPILYLRSSFINHSQYNLRRKPMLEKNWSPASCSRARPPNSSLRQSCTPPRAWPATKCSSVAFTIALSLVSFNSNWLTSLPAALRLWL
jgi:hypothetical protein